MLKEKSIKYLGVEAPKTKEEIEVEIAGLINASKQAEEQVSRLQQSIALFMMELSKGNDECK